jgi:hypothetical protein
MPIGQYPVRLVLIFLLFPTKDLGSLGKPKGSSSLDKTLAKRGK